MSRALHLNAFLMSSGHHEAAWRLEESDPYADYDAEHWIGLAQLAERGTMDAVFFADGPSLGDGVQFRPAGQLDPVLLLALMAARTTHIGLITTSSTTYNPPYNLARQFASLDHLSGGRAGWNIVTTADKEAAANFGLEDRPDHADRYARAREFMDVVLGLWDSWEDAAIVADKESGRYTRPDSVHEIEHDGEYYRVRGPLNVPRSPQGYPVLVQAGASHDGKEFAARTAEAVFTAQQTLADAQEFYADVKARAKAAGRDPRLVKILPGIVPVLGSTEAEAHELAQRLEEAIVPEYGLGRLAEILEVPTERLELNAELPEDIVPGAHREGFQSRADLVVTLARRDRLTVRQLLGRLGGGRGHWTVVGTPEQIADKIQLWFEHGAADGFNIMGPLLPSSLEHFVEHVIPILRTRGLFRTQYEGTTLRDHYGLPRPVSRRLAAVA